MQYFAVFIKFSGDNCMPLSRLKLHDNQQEMKEMRRDRESRFQASHVFTLAGQAQAVRLSYKLQFKSLYISLQY